MGLINKLGSGLADKPVFRFSGWEKLGAQTRPADTRTETQLLATIDALAEKNPSVKTFIKDLKEMPPKYLGLAADTMELASRREMLMTDIDMNEVSPQTGKTLLQYLLGVYPKAAKENPAAMDFTKAVINNTDTLTSKYYLADFSGIFNIPQAAKHLRALEPSIKDIADSTINKGYTGDFTPQKNFMNMIDSLIHPEAKPEKIALLKNLGNAADKIAGEKNPVYVDRFTRSDAPLEQVKQNLARLSEGQKAAKAEGKTFDIVDFVNYNTNFAKARKNQNVNLNGLKYNA